VVKIKQQLELLQTGMFEELVPTKKQTVADLLKELSLSGDMLGVIVNGVKAELEDFIDKEDSVVIIPNIAGG